MTVLAWIRPDSWNIPLFLHVLGAMIFMGALLTAASVLALARGRTNLLRLGYFSLLAVGLPGYLVMRIGAEWLYSKEGWKDAPSEPLWIGIGYATADIGGLLLLVALLAGGFGVRKLRSGGGVGLVKASLIISTVLLVMYVVTIWAMGAKPS